jgi:hypothetical protein
MVKKVLLTMTMIVSVPSNALISFRHRVSEFSKLSSFSIFVSIVSVSRHKLNEIIFSADDI